MDLELIRPSESPRIIDLVAEVGIDTSGWLTKEDGTPCVTPASNPNYCYEWCFRDFEKKLLLINLWFDETTIEDDRLVQKFNMRKISSTDDDSNRRKRASSLDSALWIASLGEWTIRTMILGREYGKDGKSRASKRLLDPTDWLIRKYDEETGDCVLERNGETIFAADSSPKGWTQEELRASIEAYVVMRDKQTAGEPFVKKEVYRLLAERFDRTEKSFEFRMQNISHILSLQGREWVTGLRPAKHVGANMTREIELLLAEVEKTSPTDLASFNSQVDTFSRKGLSEPPSGNKAPSKSESTSTSFNRSPQVVAWILGSANGLCESCGCPSPFVKDDGSPYLEVHHVVRLADNGPDTIENAVALCPNCHRGLHYAADKHVQRELLYKKISRLKKPYRAV
jgi:5-methylcytosine-specific restriction protein A